MFQKIIVGIDQREQRREPLALARLIAGGANERLVVATVYAHRVLPHGVVDTSIRDDADELLAREADTLPGARFVAVSSGSVGRGLHELAELEQADVIVLGASHRGAMGRVLLGSTAEAVLHHAPCAVCVAPLGFAPESQGIRLVGVGYGAGPDSERALAVAERIARENGASLRVWSMVAPVDPLGGAQPDGEETQRKLDAALDRLEVPAEGEVVHGAPGPELERRSTEVDLLVLGSRDQPLVERLVLGSTSRQLLHGACCPVLVVPRAAERPEASSVATPADTAV
jgi:nucleotide-binding universal stress UspA family protein